MNFATNKLLKTSVLTKIQSSDYLLKLKIKLTLSQQEN